MATGMEMMVAAVLKASGIDPDKVKDDIAGYGKQLAEKIASMDAALAQLGRDQSAMKTAMEGLRAGQIIVSDLLYEMSRGTPGRARIERHNGREKEYDAGT